MDSRNVDALQIRFQKLEWQLRAVIVGWVLSVTMLVVLGAGMQHAMSQPVMLRAQAISITDAAGRVRARLSTRDDGSPALDLFDSAGLPRAILAMSSGNAVALSLGAARGKANTQLVVSAKGDAQLLFHDASENLRAGISMFSDGSVALAFIGTGNNGVLVSLKNDMPSVELTDKDGFEANLGGILLKTAVGTTMQRSAASLVLLGNGRNVLWSAP